MTKSIYVTSNGMAYATVVSLVITLVSVALLTQPAHGQNAPISIIPATATTSNIMDVPIITADFSNILSMNLQLNYDTAVGMAVSINNGTSLGGNFNINISEPGVIHIGWYTAVPVTLPDSSTIFNLQFERTGTGSLSLTWYDNGYSCTYSDANFITLNDLPTATYYINNNNQFVTAVLPAPAGNISGPDVVCSGNTATYSIEPIANATGYEWVIPDNSTIISGNNTPIITIAMGYNTTGVFLTGITQVSGTNQYGTGNPSLPHTITIPPLPEITLQPISDTAVEGIADTAFFNTWATGNVLQYHWQEYTVTSNTWTSLTENGLYQGTQTNKLSLIDPPLQMNGNHYRCIVTDSCGDQLITNGAAKLSVTIPSNTTTLALPEFKAWPNPFNQILNLSIQSPTSGQLTITIYDIAGTKLIHRQTTLQPGLNNLQLNTSTLNPGFYLIKASISGSSRILKLVKQ